ncbi:MAG: exosortase-associated EpsI family protein [Verrucomicrobiota bacterium]
MMIKPRHWLWVGLGVMMLFSLLWSLVPSGLATGRLRSLPLKGFGFVGRDLPFNQTEQQIYHEAEAIKRLYQTRGQGFILTAIDGTRDRHAVHDPLYCFRGDGWQVVRQQTLAVPGGRANLVTLTRSGRQTEAVFWFTNGRERQDSAWRGWWLGLRRRLTFGQSGSHDPALVLLQPANNEAPVWTSVFAQCPFLFEI